MFLFSLRRIVNTIPVISAISLSPLTTNATVPARLEQSQQDGSPPTMFRGDPSHQGVAITRGLETLGGLAWTFETGGPIRSSPTLDRGTLYFGSSDGSLYAVTADDGDLKWRITVGSPIGSSPAVIGNLVLFSDRTNTVRAVHRADGRQIWSLETGPDLPLSWGLEGWDYIGASAVVVTAPSFSNPIAVFGSGNGSVYAVDATDGTVHWTFPTNRRIRSTPAVFGNTVYIGGGDGVVYALDLEGGTVRWTFETSGVSLNAEDFGFDRTQIQASPAIANGVVYIGSRDASMYALNAETGSMVWHTEDGSAWVVSSAAVRDQMVFNGRSSSGNFRRLDAATGKERWVLGTGGAVFSSPTLVGNTIYFGNGAGWIHAVNVEGGSVRWRYRAGRGIYSSPVISDGRLYVGSDDGILYALQAGPDRESPRLAVFWDDSLTTLSVWGGQERHRHAAEYFESYGYERLDEAGLQTFLRERMADQVPSVVVFGMDVVVDGLADGPPESTLLRRYLASGGKVVWLGMPPLMLSRNEAGNVTGVTRERTTELLGVDHSKWDSDMYGVFPTEDGIAWGLDEWTINNAGATTEDVDVVLARDELGKAAAWVKSYSRTAGRGFVMVPGSTSIDRLSQIRRVAEIGILRPYPVTRH